MQPLQVFRNLILKKDMKNILMILMVLVTMVSCDVEDEMQMPVTFGDGTYVGIFFRSSPTIKSRASNITLTFDKGRFTGQSDIAYYPAICSGTYTFTGHSIDFSNECGWTAQFDWTFILNGSFEVETSEDKLILKRSYEGDVTDMYILTRQKAVN